MTYTPEELEEKLVEAGVPKRVAEQIAAQKPSRKLYFIGAVAFIIVTCSGFFLGAFLWEPLASVIEARAIGAAQADGSVLYWTNFGVAPLVAIFGWIFASGAGTYGAFMISPRFRASAFAYSILDPRNRGLQRLPASRDDGSETADDYIRRALGNWIRLFSWGAAVLFALAFVILDRERDTYTLYSPTGFWARPLLPWDEEVRRNWREATRVELGCNHVVGRNASDDVIYDVVFPGRTERISSATPVGVGYLDALEKIDDALRESKVEFKRWSWLSRDPMHPDCLKHWRVRLTDEDYARLSRLLRFGELQDDH